MSLVMRVDCAVTGTAADTKRYHGDRGGIPADKPAHVAPQQIRILGGASEMLPRVSLSLGRCAAGANSRQAAIGLNARPSASIARTAASMRVTVCGVRGRS